MVGRHAAVIKLSVVSNVSYDCVNGTTPGLLFSGIVLATGFSYLQFADLNSPRNLFVIGFSLYWGISFRDFLKSFGSETPFEFGKPDFS